MSVLPSLTHYTNGVRPDRHRAMGKQVGNGEWGTDGGKRAAENAERLPGFA